MQGISSSNKAVSDKSPCWFLRRESRVAAQTRRFQPIVHVGGSSFLSQYPFEKGHHGKSKGTTLLPCWNRTRSDSAKKSRAIMLMPSGKPPHCARPHLRSQAKPSLRRCAAGLSAKESDHVDRPPGSVTQLSRNQHLVLKWSTQNHVQD